MITKAGGTSDKIVSTADFFSIRMLNFILFHTPMQLQLHKVASSAFMPRNIRTEEKFAVEAMMNGDKQ